MKPNILFDLDGTLTDPKVGIITCIQFALQKADLPVPEMKDLLWCIGPPLHKSFEKLAPEFSAAGVWELVSFYRERFSKVGLFENQVYSEVENLLRILSSKKNLYLATSKPHVFAEKILEHFKLKDFFRGIYGSELDGQRTDKGELIHYILEKENLASKDCLMIGDREHDVAGAKWNEVFSIGVTWGYGSREELEKAGASLIVDAPNALENILLE